MVMDAIGTDKLMFKVYKNKNTNGIKTVINKYLTYIKNEKAAYIE